MAKITKSMSPNDPNGSVQVQYQYGRQSLAWFWPAKTDKKKKPN